MIFITVGTHEQQFDRLIRYADVLIAEGIINEKMIIQTGYSTYVPKYAEWSRFLSCDQMLRYLRDARIVITHGGPSSFMKVLTFGKIPVVMPRMKKYGEHINNHQQCFVKAVYRKYHNIIPVESMEDLKKTIANYEEITADMSAEYKMNNSQFADKLDILVSDMMKVNNNAGKTTAKHYYSGL